MQARADLHCSSNRRPGRPYGSGRGVIREALAAWARSPDAAPATVPELTALVPGASPLARAEVKRVRDTIMHMVAAGELRREGRRPSVAGGKGHMMFSPVAAMPAPTTDELSIAMRAWHATPAAL
jgi:hypothetical protein